MSGLGFGMEEEPPHDPRPQRRAAGFGVIAVLVVLIAIVIIVGRAIAGIFGGGGDYSGEGTGTVLVVVHPGDTASAIASTLVRADVVKSTTAFTSAADANPKSRQIQPGTYRLHEHMKASYALALMLRPSALVSYTVPIPEGFTVADIVARIAADTPISTSSLRSALANPASLGLPSWAQGHVEGFLFPATYQVTPGETATQLLSAMVTRFDQAANDVKLSTGAAKVGLSEYDVITLASIVQREGRLVGDYRKIAEVFFNRLHDQMRLDSDATLYYVLGPNHGPLTSSDLAMDSPYNTRKYAGLPPTPINSPGEAAIDAVLHHATGPYLYFVTIDQAGHTAFATTLQRFNELVAQSHANGVS
ncbi:MAG TPA: endolytic transglycosylase MltG [Mycobacteriales bacterium]|nr:endolytic transglycosylase MltG [Mycobacteriales bacterium]